MGKHSLLSKSYLFGVGFFLSLTSVSVFASNHLRIVDKQFTTPLVFTVDKNVTNTHLPSTFTLAKNEATSIKTPILNSREEVYIGVKPANAAAHTYAFFGVNKYGKKLVFYGYQGVGIAYSWFYNKNSKNVSVKFCTPQYYANNNHC